MNDANGNAYALVMGLPTIENHIVGYANLFLKNVSFEQPASRVIWENVPKFRKHWKNARADGTCAPCFFFDTLTTGFSMFVCFLSFTYILYS